MASDMESEDGMSARPADTQKPLPWEMCNRVDRLMNEADELIDHLLVYATDHDCSYAVVELRRIQARAESAIQFIEERKVA